jgi:hypothetical protein
MQLSSERLRRRGTLLYRTLLLDIRAWISCQAGLVLVPGYLRLLITPSGLS